MKTKALNVAPSPSTKRRPLVSHTQMSLKHPCVTYQPKATQPKANQPKANQPETPVRDISA